MCRGNSSEILYSPYIYLLKYRATWPVQHHLKMQKCINNVINNIYQGSSMSIFGDIFTWSNFFLALEPARVIYFLWRSMG